MKTSYLKTLSLVFSLLTISIGIEAQHTEIEHNSTGTSAQLQLTETQGGAAFGRLTFQNQEKGSWTLAGRTGGGTSDDDFNLYYDDSSSGVNIFSADGENRLMNFETDLKINNHLTEPNLTFDVEGQNFAHINFEANAGSGIGGYFRYFAQQGGTAIPSYFELSAPGGDNFMTMFGGGSTTFGPGALGSGSGGSARLRVVHNSTSTSPTFRLVETDDTDFVRLFFTNQNVPANRFSIAARPGSATPRMDLGYNGLSILSIHADDINAGGSDGRVGINDVSPTYALELPNNSTIEIGQARAQDWDTYSDARVKTDIKSLDSAIDAVKELNPVSYKHHSSTFEKGQVTIDENEYQLNLGFLAQEVYEILPEAVTKPKDENDDLWAMSYDKLIPVLTKAMQEQQVIIEDLQKEVASLKIAVAKK